MELVVVGIETTEGAHYTFPDMDKEVVSKIFGNDGWRRLSSLGLTNISKACLIVPTRIIQSITMNGEVKWTASPV